MNLSFEQIKDITLGAAQVVQEEDGVHFHRFTRAQEELYRVQREHLYKKTFHTSGIALSFRTNSTTLQLTGEPYGSTGRYCFSLEVQVNGQTIGAVENYSTVDLPDNYASIKLPLEPFDSSFNLGPGEKDVRVNLPWPVALTLSRISLDDGAFVTPVKPKYQMLCYGDSITHGYDALLPSRKYVSQLAQYLEAEEHNKAIGGDWFFPELVLQKEDFEPDYISVAYGTNDWSRWTLDVIIENSKAFFVNIHSTYPNAKVFVITPIWRKDEFVPRKSCDFAELEGIIADAIRGYDNMMLIPGYDLVPHDESYYSDLRLHPNDKGFACYFAGIRKYIEQL